MPSETLSTTPTTVENNDAPTSSTPRYFGADVQSYVRRMKRYSDGSNQVPVYTSTKSGVRPAANQKV